MRERSKKRLGELLIEAGVLSKGRLEEALALQKKEGGLIGQILLTHGMIQETDLTAALSHQLRVPFLSLENYAVNPDAVLLLEESFCRGNSLIAFDVDEKRIFVALADPLNEPALEEVEKQVGRIVKLFISTPTEIMNALDVIAAAVSFKKGIKKAG